MEEIFKVLFQPIRMLQYIWASSPYADVINPCVMILMSWCVKTNDLMSDVG